jgi:eukaryotic-like serine/threonine-protein kinase
LTPGTRIGPYEVVSAIGAGGMGEVYRARDPRLGRDVALKVLPAAFSRDADRLARFEREARVLAAFSHPHIAALYGLEEGEGRRAIVMELVEGETLADRLRTAGALPFPTALGYARQIASALDAAHESGIVHRDLKPANIKITPAGVVKVLDFGLAKAIEPVAAVATSAETLGATRAGAVLGTAAYMSPEQARGQAVDKRTDIWAFGCVFYEMLAGRPAFAAETVSDTIARVLNGEPDWAVLSPDVPPAIRAVLERCLARDVALRLRDLGDFEPMVAAAPAAAVPARMRRPYLGWLGAAAAGVVLGWLIAAARSQPATVEAPAAAPMVQFDVPVEFDRAGAGAFSLAPDGQRLAYVAGGADGALRIWLRELGTRDARPISGSEGEVAFNTSNPIWSPDGRALAFYSDGRLKRIDSHGGTVETVCPVPGVAIGGTWGANDVIVVGTSGGGLLRCPAGGGEPTRVTAASADDELHVMPFFLPGDARLLYLKVVRSNPEVNGLYAADLNAAPNAQPAARLIATGFGAAYVAAPEGGGRLVIARDRALWAVQFDPARLAVEGEPERVAEPVGSFLDGAFFSAARDALAYRGDPAGIELVWHDRQGRRIGKVGGPGAHVGFALSPNGSQAAVLRSSRANRADQDVWLVDVGRDTTTRLTVDPQLESVPTWSVDGAAVIFGAGHGAGDILMQPLNGAGPVTILRHQNVTQLRVNPLLTTLSPTPDGRSLLFTAEGDPRTRSDLWMVDLQPDGRLRPVLQQEFDQSQAVLSPDGRWLAHVSNESGTGEVFVRRFAMAAGADRPTLGPPLLVSRGGGRAPRWRNNSRELFYQSGAGSVMAVRMSGGGPERPSELFRVQELLAHWGVAPDGERFLLGVPVTPQAPNPIRLALNWQASPR